MKTLIMGKTYEEAAEKIGVGNISYKLYVRDGFMAILVRDIDTGELIQTSSGPTDVMRKHWEKI